MFKTNKVFSWSGVLFWMSLIFYLSHQPATTSSELSTGIVEVIVQSMENVAPFIEIEMGKIHHITRKGAHFFAYFILGVLVINALRTNHKFSKRIGIAFVICVAYAVTDEVHQLFIPGRSGEAMDVLIDSAGASVGIFIYIVIAKLISNK